MLGEPSERDSREQQLDALIAEYYQAAERGSPPSAEQFIERHPEFAGELKEFFADFGKIEAAAAPLHDPLELTQPITGSHPPVLGQGTAIRYFGEYEVLSVLGIGGMGVVYKARQSKLKKIVALKMIKDGELASKEDVQRFMSEARAAARLEHPGIVAVHEVGQFQGMHYYTMDFLGGGSLANLNRDQPVASRRAAEIVKQLAEAMQYAHSQGIVHRDLKPSNVLLTVGGVPRITDFGLAKRLWSSDESVGVTMTETGQVLGTAGYMSPEQAAGKARLVGTSADVYALGAVLYALITGRAPFVGESQADIILQVIQKTPVAPRVLNPSISRDLDTICLKCLAKEPSDRYGTAQLLADDLARFLEGRPVTARPLSVATRTVRWCRRNPALASMATALVLLICGGLVAYRLQHLQNIKHHRQSQIEALVASLQSADTLAVPRIIGDLEPYRPWAAPYLEQALQEADDGSRQKLNLALAQVPVDRSHLDYLRRQLLVASPPQFVVIRDALLPFREVIVEPLWLAALDQELPDQARFQAACALATYAPEDPHWGRIGEFVIRHLVSREATELVAWRATLSRAREQLIPTLQSIYRDSTQREQARVYATETLAEYLDSPAALFGLLADAEQFQFPTILARLTPKSAIPLAVSELRNELPSSASDLEREQLAQRQANAAIALLHWGAPTEAWPILAHSADPRARSNAIHWLVGRGIPAATLVERFKLEPDSSIRQGLLLALGEYDTAALPAEQRGELVQELRSLLEGKSAASVRAAAEWLLRKWGEGELVESVIAELSSKQQQSPPPHMAESSGEQNWFVTPEGHTMVVLKPESLPAAESGTERPVVKYHFAISAHEVTGTQFIRCDDATELWRLSEPFKKTFAGDVPCQSVTWFDAAGYCNWLSGRHGIPEKDWCYTPTSAQHYAPGMKLKPNALSLRGYRLPTESEWLYACQAGTITSQHFGSAVALQPKYAWYQANADSRIHPVGTLKPNGFGLFDMLGNASEWTFELYEFVKAENATIPLNINDNREVTPHDYSKLRGGNYRAHLSEIRTPIAGQATVYSRLSGIGFRVARTVFPDDAK